MEDVFKTLGDITNPNFETKKEVSPSTDKRPLYVRLNEARSGGNWEHFLHDGNVTAGGMNVAQCRSMLLSPQTFKANANYLVMAVNNLSPIAAALSKMCEWHEKNATWDKGDNGYYAAKKSLASIS